MRSLKLGACDMLKVVSSLWLEYPLLLRTCRLLSGNPFALPFREGYGFLPTLPDGGEVSDDELEPSAPPRMVMID